MEAATPQTEIKIERLSNTSLSEFKRSPLHYLHYKDNKSEPTDAMRFGAAMHCYILQNNIFKDEYFVFDPSGKPVQNKDFRNNENKMWMDAELLKSKDKTVISLNDLTTIQNMNESLLKHKPAMELMEQLETMEESINWINQNYDIPMTGKLDGKAPSFTLDLKSCDNASNEQFTKDAFNKDYTRQGAIYVDGRLTIEDKVTDFYFIAIEKAAPYAVSVQKCSRQFLAHGTLHYENLLADWVKWNEAGRPAMGYEWKNKQGYFDLNLPSWIK